MSLAIEGCQHLCQSETTKKEPVTSEMIKSLIRKFKGFRYMSVGFSVFLRMDELLSIKIKHPKVNKSHLENLVPKSKIDQHRKGYIVYISRVSSECCPAKILGKYLQNTNIEISKDDETSVINNFLDKERE